MNCDQFIDLNRYEPYGSVWRESNIYHQDNLNCGLIPVLSPYELRSVRRRSAAWIRIDMQSFFLASTMDLLLFKNQGRSQCTVVLICCILSIYRTTTEQYVQAHHVNDSLFFIRVQLQQSQSKYLRCQNGSKQLSCGTKHSFKIKQS